ncbi:MAG TPA: hypothetical protein VE954_08875 [Oligoflexus sp.]|uniref:hypothetical protein n=1 Tax=Oligoflexus sp. TaxID=1971216 RepID=UPI002D42B223|nr:hypothetical protein [Oligoflexus sp.]HYX33216.1 hypothetical protein [Oligoflexus sp.]
MSWQKFAWFLLAVIVVLTLNSAGIMTSLGGDELYHADQASLGLRCLELLWKVVPAWSWLKLRPIPEIVGELNLAFTLGGLVAYYLLRRITRAMSPWLFYPILFAVLNLLCYIVSFLGPRLEVHPPLRLLPFFAGQLIFGFDDLSFRLAPILIVSSMLAATGIYVAARSKRWPLGCATVLAAGSIPSVAHVAGIVEPSVWAFCAWLGTYLILQPEIELSRQEREERLIYCGLWVGFFALARQTSIVIWPVLGLYLLLWRASPRTWILTLLPGLFFLPTLYTMKQLNHVAAQGASMFQNILSSIVTGRGFQAIFQALTPIWIFCLFLLVAWHLWRFRSNLRTWPFVFGLIPAYLLYFSIWDYLWGLGRYHAEYGGGILVILLASAVPSIRGRWVYAVAACLFFYGLWTMRNLWQDVGYQQWPDRRITTESTYPYREALGFLKRQNIEGRIAFFGGVPVNGEMFLYLRGLTHDDIQNFRTIQSALASRQTDIKTSDDLMRVLHDLGVRWIMIQSGEKREIQHRTAEQSRLIRLVEDHVLRADTEVRPQLFSFWGRYEGAIHLVPLLDTRSEGLPGVL